MTQHNQIHTDVNIDYSKRKRTCISCGDIFYISKYVFKDIIKNDKKFPERCPICEEIYQDKLKEKIRKRKNHDKTINS